MRERSRPESIVYSDSCRYDDVLDVSEVRNKRSNRSERFIDSAKHAYGIENFDNRARRDLRRHDGIPRQHYHLLHQEYELRFNHSPASNLLNTLLTCAGIRLLGT